LHRGRCTRCGHRSLKRMRRGPQHRGGHRSLSLDNGPRGRRLMPLGRLRVSNSRKRVATAPARAWSLARAATTGCCRFVGAKPDGRNEERFASRRRPGEIWCTSEIEPVRSRGISSWALRRGCTWATSMRAGAAGGKAESPLRRSEVGVRVSGERWSEAETEREAPTSLRKTEKNRPDAGGSALAGAAERG
jgi:hypothetical protein